MLLNFKELFEDVKIVLLYRNDIENQITSGWWSEDKAASRILLMNQRENFIKFNRENPDYTYLLTMDDIISKNNNFMNMFRFLDLKFEILKIDKIIGNKIDYLDFNTDQNSD